MRSEPAVADRDTPRAHPPRVALRLRAIRGQLSIDLETPVDLGPFSVQRLAFSLPGLRFPVDLSGGVGRFRHRRGTLEVLELECHLPRLADFLAPRVRSAWPSQALRLSVLPSDYGLVVGLVGEDQALAFNAWPAFEDQDLQWIIGDARAVGLGVPAHAAALRVAEAALSGLARRSGSVFAIHDALGLIVRDVLIDAGARTPDTHTTPVTSLHATPEGIELQAGRGASPLLPPAHVIRAAALARIVSQADDALAQGDLETAREAYLLALESAPRHPDIALRVADLDLAIQAPSDAALASLVDSMPAVDGGLAAARLLAAVGDPQAAAVAARRAADSEPFAPLASLMFLEAAKLASDSRDRAALLDEAVARSPALTTCRWARARHRLSIGDVGTAMADFGSIEAATRGSKNRFDVASAAAALLLEHRNEGDAARFFERALRYAPRSIEATTGLARAFMKLGDTRRGAALLSRAVSLTARTPEPRADLLLELASALAEVARDLPAAIAHARLVPFGLPQTVAARALEGRWRASLGDLDGATVAYGHAREALESLPADAAARHVAWLLQAAEFEERERNDRRCAFRHVDAALRVSPDNPAVRSAFRRLAAQVPMPPVQHAAPASASSAASEPSAVEPASALHADTLPPPSARPDEPLLAGDAEDESRVDALTDRIRANPADHQTASELCTLLAKLGRDMDLFALVAARLEETQDSTVRRELESFKRVALQRLAAAARDGGRLDEAAIYEEALAEMQNA